MHQHTHRNIGESRGAQGITATSSKQSKVKRLESLQRNFARCSFNREIVFLFSVGSNVRVQFNCIMRINVTMQMIEKIRASEIARE